MSALEIDDPLPQTIAGNLIAATDETQPDDSRAIQWSVHRQFRVRDGENLGAINHQTIPTRAFYRASLWSCQWMACRCERSDFPPFIFRQPLRESVSVGPEEAGKK
jgi:hypothetical protein